MTAHRIDHVPVAHHDLDRLASAFVALGFNVSRPCAYESPDDPTGPWICRSVFLDHGWLDLQHAPSRPADLGGAPHAVLFRVPSLAAAASELAPFRTGPAIRLSRRWADADAPDLDLAWMALRERIAPFVLALVEYPARGPADGIARPSHPNSATRLLGLAFGGTEAGAAAAAAQRALDLSGFRYLPRDIFEGRFGRPAGGLSALRFEVRSLDATAAALDAGRLTYALEGAAIVVPAQGELACGVEFVRG
jgi:hypothetical protein